MVGVEGLTFYLQCLCGFIKYIYCKMQSCDTVGFMTLFSIFL